MRSNKVTFSLLWLSMAVVVLDLARLDLWGTTNLLYLVWNLFLAWIPYLISCYLIKTDTPLRRFIPLFILWLLFFPNAPYLLTDILHLVTSAPSLLWYDSLLFFFFGWTGMALGILSLFHIHQYLKSRLSTLLSEGSVILISVLSGFGIYLGRFERWNSWDIFVNPIQLLQHSVYVSMSFVRPGTSLVFVLVFAVLFYLSYRAMYCLLAEDNRCFF